MEVRVADDFEGALEARVEARDTKDRYTREPRNDLF